ncbi:MAG: ABC transporter ATP-binding protein [Novosphingobium sp.]|nr:ABC transporter ATP-binding protein [Novosphingobium sp.]
MENVLFSCEGIGLSFGNRPVLKDVSLHVAPGEILGLVGPNGAGKTSLFEVFTGRYTPRSGRVCMKGTDISSLSIHERARLGLARTYQSPIVPSSMSVGDVFRAAREAYRPFLSRFDAEWGARHAHLHVPWDRPAGSLDTFDRRKLMLACQFMRAPDVLLLDEPASGLINSEIDTLDIIIRHQADEFGIGVILIEHRLELLTAIADRVVVLDLGEVIASGRPDEVFSNPRVKAAYFEDAGHG